MVQYARTEFGSTRCLLVLLNKNHHILAWRGGTPQAPIVLTVFFFFFAFAAGGNFHSGPFAYSCHTKYYIQHYNICTQQSIKQQMNTKSYHPCEFLGSNILSLLIHIVYWNLSFLLYCLIRRQCLKNHAGNQILLVIHRVRSSLRLVSWGTFACTHTLWYQSNSQMFHENFVTDNWFCYWIGINTIRCNENWMFLYTNKHALIFCVGISNFHYIRLCWWLYNHKSCNSFQTDSTVNR